MIQVPRTPFIFCSIVTFCENLKIPCTSLLWLQFNKLREKEKSIFFLFLIKVIYYVKKTWKMCFRSLMLSIIFPASLSRLFWFMIYHFKAFQKSSKKFLVQLWNSRWSLSSRVICNILCNLLIAQPLLSLWDLC